MRILVSTKMCMPSGTSSSGLLAICGLRNDLLDQRVLSHGKSGKGAVDNARSLLTAVCGEMLQPEPYHLLDVLLDCSTNAEGVPHKPHQFDSRDVNDL